MTFCVMQNFLAAVPCRSSHAMLAVLVMKSERVCTSWSLCSGAASPMDAKRVFFVAWIYIHTGDAW